MDAFNHQFESLYVILHPFIGVPNHPLESNQKYPSDDQILKPRSKMLVVPRRYANRAFPPAPSLNQALLTSRRSIADRAERLLTPPTRSRTFCNPNRFDAR